VSISDQLDAEVKSILRDRLGAELVELRVPDYPDDPTVPDARYGFSDALSELLPRLMPEIFTRRDAKNELWFAVPGHDVTSYEYLMKLSRRQAPLTERVRMSNFASFAATPCANALCSDNRFDLDRYLAERGDSRITDWTRWVANARFRQSESLAGARNWAVFADHFAAGKAERLARSQVARMALQRVMFENDIDVFVHPENTVPTPRIQGPNVGEASLDGISPFFQIPRIAVPAGVTETIVEPAYALNSEGKDYISVIPPATAPSRLPHPLPISLTFFSGQGEESTLIRVGTAYESATQHRFAPPRFGPLKSR
jgi:Asp-tRNA(Asn)/Glu-tRNA(Gln) amidotransferase A subunit family amidase